MSSLLIEYKKVIKPSFDILLNKIGTPPSFRKGKLGLVLIIPKKQFCILSEKRLGKERVEYLNSSKFVENIRKFYYVIYSSDKNICEIPDKMCSDLTNICKLLKKDLPESTNLWCIFDIEDKEAIDKYIYSGFAHPYVCNKSPSGKEFENYGIALIKDNQQNVNPKKVKKEVKKVLSDLKKSGNCEVSAYFSPQTVKYLKSLTTISSSPNKDGTRSQKEVSGAFKIKDMKQQKDKVIFEMEYDQKSIISGEEEEVDAVWNRYNFHTHPEEAYERNGVKIGWPSSQDYLGFFDLNYHTIFHAVITLEGIYVISFSNKWEPKKYSRNKVRKFIGKKCDIDHKEDIRIDQYIDKIHNVKYKKISIFDVQFMAWENANNQFSISYPKTGINCLATEEVLGIVRRYHFM